MDLFDQSGAIFSSDRKYRYALWRVLDSSKPDMMFIGLNPSTANETENDPTIRRVMGMAYTLGYGNIYMMNLFAWVTPHPEELKTCADPQKDNDYWLKEIGTEIAKKGMILFAWGNFKEAVERGKEIAAMFPGAWCLVKNQDGSPRHPLYVPKTVKPILY
jgi:hypothetical protein